MSQKLRCLHLGAGGIASIMQRTLATKSWFELAGLVDISVDALTRKGDAMGVPGHERYTDFATAIKHSGAQAVLINTPSQLHYRQCLEAFDAGLHVMVAKPITNAYEEAVDLVTRAADAGVTLAVGQQIRYNRHFEAVGRFVREDHLGAVEAAWFQNSKPRPNPANLAKMEQPLLFENSCHHFDCFFAVFGDQLKPTWIQCDGFRPSWSSYVGPCMVNALIRYDSGLHLSYHGGFSTRAAMYDFRLEGVKGALECRGLHISNDTMAYRFAAPQGRLEPAEIDTDVPLAPPFEEFFERWHAYVRGGTEPPFSGRHNLKVMAMIDAATESIESGRPVTLFGGDRYSAAFLS